MFAEDDEDRWPDDPDPDPEAELADPERELPSIPEPPTPDPGEIDAEVARAFWAAVVLANVGLFAASLGAMLAGFRGQWRLGGLLVVVGLVALAGTVRQVRGFRTRDEEGEVGDERAEDGDEGGEGGDEDEGAERNL